MIVYGDRRRTDLPVNALGRVERTLAVASGRADCDRYDLLTQALIEAGVLLQGMADAEFDAKGYDDVSTAQDAAMDLLLAIGRRLHAFWRGDHERPSMPGRELSWLGKQLSEGSIRQKFPEGYAFYDVHPRDYFAAAALSPWPDQPLVIGLRSIGASLGAAVAAATGGRALSLRPVGHPFRRELRLSPALALQLAAHDGQFVVVDEGPGLSGSSFGAAGDLLASLGVETGRMTFMPSHPGAPGPHAGRDHLRRWVQVRKLICPENDLTSAPKVSRLFPGFEPHGEAQDISAGGWRADYDAGRRPPAAPRRERRKFRWTVGARRYVARFAGLGAIGQEKLNRAILLHRAGFAPAPLGLREGFLLEAWEEGTPLDPLGAERSQFLAHLARYLAFRSANFPASEDDGATPAELREMAKRNIEALCGVSLVSPLAAALEGLEQVELAPVHVDGRLHSWEWVRLASGGFCKTDALDHACDHGLVGCQDIAWDVAGAEIEFDLSALELRTLRRSVGLIGGRAVSRPAVQVLGLCYAAFQGGLWAMAEGEASPAERPELSRQRRFYAHVLRRKLGWPQRRA